MLELRPVCENCGKQLPPDSEEARICSFECTFCNTCTDEILLNVCPNCGGGLEKRPIRPKNKLVRYPASTDRLIRSVTADFGDLRAEWSDIPPNQR